MLTDLRDAVRQLRKAPSFTATGLITLALGIGATTAIFTLVHQVMLKSLPAATAILRCSRGRRTATSVPTRRSSKTLPRYRPAMRLLACAEWDHRHRWTPAMGNMCPGIFSGPLACNRGLAVF
jgi:hypothetical protein